MKKFVFKEADVYASSDSFDLKSSVDVDAFKFTVNAYFFDNVLDTNPEFKEYIDSFGKMHGLKGYAILCAHGNSNGKWVYYDGDKECRIQSWIDKMDGKYAALILGVCNPGHHTPKSEKSVLLIPDKIVSYNSATGPEEYDAIFSLLAPKIGEVSNYMIEYEIKKLNSEAV